MNKPLSPYQKRKHLEALDEKHLEKHLVFLTQNKIEILFDIRQFRKKHFSNNRNHFIGSRDVVKLLNTNKRTIRLLASYKYISSITLCNSLFFNLNDVRDFIKSLTKPA
ncbi:MAG: hypothetical protein WCG93_08295 [Paludibacter sp.]